MNAPAHKQAACSSRSPRTATASLSLVATSLTKLTILPYHP